MPLRMATPMLKVDVAKMHDVDPKNVENLHNMWSGKNLSIATILSPQLLTPFPQSSPNAQNRWRTAGGWRT